MKRVVVTVGTFETDSVASNVIAHQVKMAGTVRTLDAECRELAERRIREIAEGTAMALGAKVEIKWQRGYPVTMNTAENTAYAAEVARAVSGDVDDEVDPIMPAEDFSYMLEERPGAYIFLGNGDTAACHHPRLQFHPTRQFRSDPPGTPEWSRRGCRLRNNGFASSPYRHCVHI